MSDLAQKKCKPCEGGTAPLTRAAAAALLPNLVDLGISMVVIAASIAVYGVSPTVAVLTIPLWIAALMAVAFASGLLLGTLNVQYLHLQFTSPKKRQPSASHIMWSIPPDSGVSRGTPATNGTSTTPFIVTRNELEFSEEIEDAFCLYRVFDFGVAPKLFILRGPLNSHLELEPLDYRARLKATA